MSTKKNIEAIYPLSPMQEGMLFHTLYEPQSALYFEQLSFLLQGTLDIALWQQAWQHVIDRHPALRTAYVWKGQEKPLQVVFRQVDLPWRVLDWRHLPATEQMAELEQYLQAEQEAGFNLAQPPVCQATLILLSDECCRFVWSNHHLLMDGWSLPILLREVFTSYEMLRSGSAVDLPAVRPYRDFINWLQAQDAVAAAQFWRKQLADFTTPTPLVSQGGQGWSAAKEGVQYDTWQQVVPDTLLTQVHASASAHHVTVGTMLYGAWALLLQRYSDRDDVLFGVTMAGRPHDLVGAEDMVGLFINTLPLRLWLPEEETVVAWLQSIHEQQAILRTYEQTPLAQVQEWSELPPQTALFESLLVLENYPVDNAQLRQAGLSFQVTDFQAQERTNYPLTLALRSGDTLELTFFYDTVLFTEAQIARMGAHFVRGLQQLVMAGEQQPLSTLTILTPAEETQLLQSWNDTHRSFTDQRFIPQRVSARAAQQPETPAVVQGERCLTYGELERRSNQLAHALQTMGIDSEARVAVICPRSPELVLGALAVMKAGGAYVPLDATLPQERLSYMLETIETAVILTTTSLQKQIPTAKSHILLLDDDALYTGTETAVVPSTTPQTLAYVIFTSGSTGRPKGVVVSHGGLRNLVNWYNSAYEVTNTSRATLLANPAFDASVMEIWPCLTQGASLHIAAEDGPLSPSQLVAWLTEDNITHCFMPTPLAEAVLHEVWPAAVTLRYLFTGGDQMRSGKPSSLPFRVINLYGPTEDSVVTTCAEVSFQSLPPIGRPLPNKQVYVLDKQLRLVPIGVPGELYIGGSGLAHGYLGEPALTAEKFIPNPFAQADDEHNRLYKTGDLVRYRADGNLEFLGRLDNQVKIGGKRIELGEIEAALARHPGVKQAAIIVWKNQAGTKQLLAYITVAQRIPPSLREMERFLKRSLPAYMLPKSFFILPEIPLTSNGKLDRKALPLPEETNLTAQAVPPRTETEKQLVDIWQQVLGLEKLGIEHNFFELGGDSILSIQLVSRATQAGLHFTVKQVFQYPTIATLVPHVRTTTAVQAEQGVVTGPVPLTPIQRWFLAQPLPNHGYFNQAFLLVARQTMQPELVEQALNHLVAHHDALRMRYHQTETGWEQMGVTAGEPVPFMYIDLADTPDAEIATAINTIANEVQASFDLASGVLVRGVWFDLGQERPSRFLWVIHHLVVDGFSWRVLLADLQTAYHQLRRGKMVKLPAKTTSYKYWAERLTTYAAQSHFDKDQQTWLDLLAQPTALLPMDKAEGRALNREGSVAEIAAALTTEETAWLLQEAPKALNTEINDLLLTALTQTITKWMQTETMLVDLESHGRLDLFDDVDLSRTVGWFTSLYPLRLSVAPTDDVGTALKKVKQQRRQIPEQGISYGAIRFLQNTPTFTNLPQSEIRFNYMGQYDQNFSDEVSLIPAQESGGVSLDPAAPRTYLFDIAGGVLREQMHFTWLYSTAVYEADTIRQLVDDLVAHLRDIITYGQTSQAEALIPSDFPSANLDQGQLDQFLTAINAAE